MPKQNVTATLGSYATNLDKAYISWSINSQEMNKGVGKKNIRSARLDVAFGAFWTDFVAYFIIISCAATLFVKGIRIENAIDAAQALGPLLGEFAKHLFAWGLLNASLLGVCVISLGTAYAISEVLGTERKVNASFKQAPLFYSIIGFCVFSCTLLVLIPNLPMIFILTASQALNTMVLPFIFFVMLKLINDKKTMGTNVNSPWENVVAWLTIGSFTLISFLMLYLIFF